MGFRDEDKTALLDDDLCTAVRPSSRNLSFLGKSKSSKLLTSLSVLTIFMLVFLLIFRALDVIPRRINVVWLSESSLKVDIQFYSPDQDSLYPTSKQSNAICDISDNAKFDCYPEGNSNEEKCLKRGCCWQPPTIKTNGLPPLDTPYCYYSPDYNGYEVQNVSTKADGLIIKLLRKQPSGFPDDIRNVVVNVTYLDNTSLQIKVYDAHNARYEVPIPLTKNNHNQQVNVLNYKVESDKRRLWITRLSTGATIFNVSLATLIFADQMLQASIILPSHYLYGISEVKDKLLRGTDWKRYVLFTRDRKPVENMNLYGSHPFYLVMENDGNSHGVLLYNSNAMEVVTQPTPAITFRPIGGILDFYIFTGPSPGAVVSQLTAVIGRSFMPPYWSLGFHLCRYGYNSVNKTREVWQRTRNNGIPMDTQWNDIDYMNKFNDFTINNQTFRDLPEFVKDLHNYDTNYIMIIDPGISNAEPAGTYPPFDDGLEMDIFVKNTTGQLQIGKVWNTVSTVFPDFTNPKSVEYWTKQLDSFHKLVPFDGVWIDMNEPSNFADGSIYGCPENSSLENPPFVPGGIEPLRSRTLCMTSKQYISDHYNIHNLYGLTELMATNAALKTVLQKRPFIISRSTFPGSGHYGGHWDGDISSTWEDMKWTISSILTLNMVGISMAGADICGFDGNTTVELCARWSALGAFYPFSRNHNADDTIEQDPVALGEPVISSARFSLTVRYLMLPTLYTLFYRSHVFGETVVRPMFFEFPNDVQTYNLDQQFMWGRDILIIPVLEQGKLEVTAYIPAGKWVNATANQKIFDVIISKGENITFPTDLNTTNILFRAGGSLVVQELRNTTAASRKDPFVIHMFLNETGYAKGELYWDDGISIDSYEKGLYSLIKLEIHNNTFTAKPVYKGFEDFMRVNTLVIQGIPAKPNTVMLNGKQITSFTYAKNTMVITEQWSLLEDSVVTWN